MDNKSQDDSNLLSRIDERTLNLVSQMEEIKETLENKYVTQAEFLPIRNIAYGLVSIIVVAVVGALIALVIK